MDEENKWPMKGGFITLGSAIIEAYTFDDCILAKTTISHYLILKFRNEFVHKRISKNKYLELIENSHI